MRREKKEQLSKAAASGIVALIFLILGFQIAVFVMKVGKRSPVAGETPKLADHAQDSVLFPASPAMPETASARTRYGGYPRLERALPPGRKSGGVQRRRVESFAFDPNTVSVADLQRLGLTERQAASIEHYRSKGGRFRSKSDFQKMYVVSDSLYERLAAYIEIPKLELNTADSAALVTLRGIGPWYARRILDYRDRLGGFRDKTQLMEIDGIDAARYAGFADAVTVDDRRIRLLDLWHAADSVLARHPYLGPRGARSVVRYRELYDSARWTLPDLIREQVLSSATIENLKGYVAFPSGCLEED